MCPCEIETFAEDLIKSGYELIAIVSYNKPNSMTELDFVHLREYLAKQNSKIKISYQTKT